MFFVTPIPPGVMIEPVDDDVESVAFVVLMLPPVVMFFATPIPPLNVTPPVVTDVESVMLEKFVTLVNALHTQMFPVISFHKLNPSAPVPMLIPKSHADPPPAGARLNTMSHWPFSTDG